MLQLNVKYALAITAVLFLLMLPAGPGLCMDDPGVTVPEKKILDMHAHIGGIGAGNSGCFISDAMRKSWKFGIYLKAFGVSEEELIEQGDSIIIERMSKDLAQSKYVDAAVVLALDGVINDSGELDRARTELYVPNEYVAREIRKYKNLYFGASINPYRTDALQRLDQVSRQGAVLIKWIPSVQLIDPADEGLVPFYLRLKELGIPLLTHTGDERSFTRARNEYGDPQRLHLPLKMGVTVIAAHAASGGKNEGDDNMERLLPMFGAYPNLYADISSLTQINKVEYLPKLLAHRNIYERLLYGTDMPLPETGLSSPFFHIFKLSPRELISLLRTGNPWDRDVMLKKALGVPEEIFTNSSRMFRYIHFKR